MDIYLCRAQRARQQGRELQLLGKLHCALHLLTPVAFLPPNQPLIFGVPGLFMIQPVSDSEPCHSNPPLFSWVRSCSSCYADRFKARGGLFALKTLTCEFEGSAVFCNGPYNLRRHPTRDRRLDLKGDFLAFTPRTGRRSRSFRMA